MSGLKQIQIDAGNSYIKVRLVDRGPPFELYRINDPVTELPTLLRDLSLRCEEYEVLIASVVSETKLNRMIETFRQLNAGAIYLARDIRQFDALRFCYEQISRLGVDRSLAMIGALHLSNHDGLCVVDVGTAITIDLIDEQHHHRGGFIVPGMAMMAKALCLSTDKVYFDSSCESHSFAPGCDTQSCVLNGINGVLWGIARFIQQTCKKFGRPQVVLTGGGAEHFSTLLADGHFRSPARVEPDLIFWGLEKAREKSLLEHL